MFLKTRKKYIVFFIITILSISIYIVIKPYYDFLTKTLHISPLKTFFSWNSLQSYNGSVNILILGIAGGFHDGANLSDSIIVAHYNMRSNKLITISIPRDVWSETMKDKINTAFAYGEAKQENGGLKLAKAETQAIVGIPIQYGVILNFAEFKELIDFLGGVNVNVERSFIDERFPIAGKENDECDGDETFACRYETVLFKKGYAHFNGETALKFVRSRHAEGIEGGDFARAKRQQKVLIAIKNKVILNLKTLNIKKLEELYRVFNKLIKRDITNQQVAILFKYIFLGGKFEQKEIALTQDFFYVPDSSEYEGKYVLVPFENNPAIIYEYIQCYVEGLSSCEEVKKRITKI